MMRHVQPNPAFVRLPPKLDVGALLAISARLSIVLLATIAMVVALHLGRYILSPIALAIVIGLMFGPVATRLEDHHVPKELAAILGVILFFALIAIGAVMFAVPLSVWAEKAPVVWQELRQQLIALKQPLEMLGTLQDQIRNITGAASAMAVKVEDGSTVQNIALLAPAILGQVLIFLASLYFFVATRNEISAAILSMCVGRRIRWRVAHVFRDVEADVSRYLLSITVINAGMGVAVGLAMWLVGVPSPALWGGLAAILNYVVYIGPALMTAILLGVGLATFDGYAVFLPAGAYLLVELLEGQFVTPHVIGRTMTLNPFMVFLALTFWLWIWGPIGGFIAVPSLLVLYAVTRNILPHYRQKPAKPFMPRAP
ncbi:AI-2E family transporter [Phyllobacterium phragmitis]|uniref:AI-2E family transporter n=2 Tax=Phyllobacterium phragmitis TaxID=2670329 RepID=A0A2S9IU69_9HYPH|nr:AI-2E family transporter [Phyllobacterium phragmitis]